jgi:hypothetical protein
MVPYSYQVSVTDPFAGDNFTYTLLTAPGGMAVAPNGLITWTPNYTQMGEKPVLLRVGDIIGNTVEQSFTVNTTKVNMAPAISSTPVLVAAKTFAYSYQVVASDLNGDILSYSLPVSPTGMNINSSGLVAWTPTEAQLGTNNVTVRVSDGTASTDQNYIVTVYANEPPVFTSTPVTNGTNIAAYSYQAVTTDPENDPRTYTLTTAPAGMTINATTGLVSWASPVVGTHNVTIRAFDGYSGSNQSYTLTIYQAPATPTGITASPATISCGVNTLITMGWNTVAGPGGHAVQYQVEALGSPQAWISATSFQYTYSADFNYRVRSRDAVTLVESAWSDMNYVYDDCSGW